LSLHRLPAAAGGHEHRQLSGEVRLAGGSLVALDRRLEQRELGDHQPFGCCVQGQRAARRPAVHERRPAGVGDERSEAFDLPLNGVRLGVGAVAAAPAVVDVHGEVLRQQLDRWPLGEVAAVQDPDPA
jgi:hypothetical protein